MIQTTKVFIPIPKVRNTHCKIEINGDDRTNRIIESKFLYPTTIGIGTFSLVLSNANGQFTGEYSEGDSVKFYADNSDGTTLQFFGRIDHIKDSISSDGQFLEIDGRHRSYLLTEHLVCYSAISTSPSQILKDIIDDLPEGYGFTQNNINSDTESMDVEWNYKPFWECVFELCKYAEFDCYVDNDLDFHYFEANSIANKDDAIVEGDNFLETKDWGTNHTYEKTRVIVIGLDAGGLPIIYTAISPDEGSEIKEFFIRNSSANTMTKVRNIAEAKLEEVTNRNPQANIFSYGLETIKPGENIWLLIPREKISGFYKIIRINHKFGSKVGGWRTECLIEEEETGISQMIQKVSKQTRDDIRPENIHKMNYSWNIDFSSDSGTHSNTEISDGVLKVVSGQSTGTWISETFNVDEDLTTVESRVNGSGLAGTKIRASLDGGATYAQVGGPGTWRSFAKTGRSIKIKVHLAQSNAEVSGLAMLYS